MRFRSMIAVATVLAVLVQSPLGSAPASAASVLIRGGTIHTIGADGVVAGDVLITDGRIAARLLPMAAIRPSEISRSPATTPSAPMVWMVPPRMSTLAAEAGADRSGDCTSTARTTAITDGNLTAVLPPPWRLDPG